MPKIFTEVRDSGPDRQKDVGSPVDILVDTVVRLQLGKSLRGESTVENTGHSSGSACPSAGGVYNHKSTTI